MRRVRITYTDGHVEYIDIRDPFAALEHTAAHGPVLRSTLGPREEPESDLGRPRSRLERSMAA